MRTAYIGDRPWKKKKLNIGNRERTDNEEIRLHIAQYIPGVLSRAGPLKGCPQKAGGRDVKKRPLGGVVERNSIAEGKGLGKGGGGEERRSALKDLWPELSQNHRGPRNEVTVCRMPMALSKCKTGRNREGGRKKWDSGKRKKEKMKMFILLNRGSGMQDGRKKPVRRPFTRPIVRCPDSKKRLRKIAPLGGDPGHKLMSQKQKGIFQT